MIHGNDKREGRYMYLERLVAKAAKHPSLSMKCVSIETKGGCPREHESIFALTFTVHIRPATQ